MVTQRLERMVTQVRRWRSTDGVDPLPVSPSLPDGDVRRLRKLIDECISDRGGEVAARRRASAIGGTYLELDDTGKQNFFRLLADEYDHDDAEVDEAIDRVLRARDDDKRRAAERHLATTLRPKRERLLRRFVGLDGGLQFLVDLREELLTHRSADGAMSALDDDLRSVLEGWFDLALLELKRLSWDTPAALLEKLIDYEAVHAIESWDDLRGRLGPGRRCYAYIHPMMPAEPLIFVEVALTKGIADSLVRLLDHDAEPVQLDQVDTAIFYSISNCQNGLRGVSLGDLLIKRVVEELTTEQPNLKTFATLSPIPGFRTWLIKQSTPSVPSAGEATAKNATQTSLLDPAEAEFVSPGDPADALYQLHQLVSQESPPPASDLERWRPILMRLCASYLVDQRRGSRALDAVAHFHLSNGARVEQLNWRANPGQSGWMRGLGMMVNYRYLLKTIEANHDSYISESTIDRSSEVEKLRTTVAIEKGRS